ncbi:lytic murein transglycosylase [Zoogloea sp.]|uniref:lytic murein transglycosylase n=1 Tax=Zoogloea sp. TaxID=49181 RepID=UPI00262B5987|nr:lytic murein transglycosylase [Zoogloea sp.]MDD3352991.1 lytic murein transglycosylase [Zoogloea sp.]
MLAAGLVQAADVPDPSRFAPCVAELKAGALGRGVSAAGYDRLTAGLQPDLKVLELLDYQPEFRTPIWDYLSGLVDDERVADGQGMLVQWRDTLNAVAARYRVDPATVVAVWGVESNFGRNFGNRPLLTSLSTLSCYGRRQAYFRGEFYDALKIVDNGDVKAEQMLGSWAGAFGHTQFMPSTFLRLAVDFDGDGRRDLVGSVPDALASTANFLRKAGWREEQPWGYEVRLPAGFDVTGAGRRNKQPLAEWSARGVRRIDGTPLEGEGSAGLLLPAGPKGPAFLVFRNFDALYAYNAAESYALAIAHLSDRLRGGGPFQTPWPTDDAGLSRAERREVQALLLARGHAIGAVDGMLGDASRAAIRSEQLRLGYSVDGRAGQKLLQALKEGR